MIKEWEDFKNGDWKYEVNVDNFIDTNFTPYEEDDSF